MTARTARIASTPPRPAGPIRAWWQAPEVRWRLGLSLILITLAGAVLATLYPFHFRLEIASLSRVDWRVYSPRHNNRDLVLNLLMLAPLGAGLALARAGRTRLARLGIEAAALGFGASLVVEALQIFERGRFPQVADVWRNGIGCVGGALLTALALRAIDRARRGGAPVVRPQA